MIMQNTKNTTWLSMRVFKTSLVLLGGVIGVLILAAIGLFFTTSGQYPVVATVIDDASLPQIEIGGVRLHAETYGDPSNPVVIVLHGGPGGDYRSLLGAKSLANTNFVVFYDQRGNLALAHRWIPFEFHEEKGPHSTHHQHVGQDPPGHL